jgi:hypothetical protein
MKTLVRVLVVGLVCAMAAACGSSGSTTATPTGAAPSVAASYVGATLTCDQFKVRAANLVSYIHYASLNVGTTNDSASYFVEMQQAMADLKANAPACAPASSASLDELQAKVDAAQAGYQASDAADAVTADKVLFDALAAQGALTWTAMQMDTQAWDTVLRYSA